MQVSTKLFNDQQIRQFGKLTADTGHTKDLRPRTVEDLRNGRFRKILDLIVPMQTRRDPF